MLNTNYKRSLKHLTVISHCLGPEDIFNGKKPNAFVRVIKRIASYCFTCLARLFNLVFGDHHWYNEAKARKVLKFYLWEAKPSERVGKNHCAKALRIFDRLSHIKRKSRKSHYVEGLDRNLIAEVGNKNADFTDAMKRVKTIEKVSDKLFFHIQAGEFGSNSQLEGLKGEREPLTFVQTFLKRRKAAKLPGYNLPDAMVQKLQKAIDLTKKTSSKGYISTLKKQAQEAINTNQSILIPGGWRGKPGHAVYYEMIPESAGRISFRIYNLGGGSNHHPQVIQGSKTKVAPYLEWKGIDASKICDEDVLKVLFEFQHGSSTDYNAYDLYTGLKELLAPTSVAGNDSKVWKTGQRSGVCGWRSLTAYFATQMEEKDYKLFMSDIRIQTLVDRVKILKKRGKKSKKESERIIQWRLIQKSFERVTKNLHKLYADNTLVGEGYMTKGAFYLRHVARWINENEGDRYRERKSFEEMKYTTPKNQVPEKLFTKKDTPLADQVGQPQRVAPSAKGTVLQQMEQVVPAGVSFSETLKSVQKVCDEALDSEEFFSLQIGLDKFLATLPLREQYYRDRCKTKEQAKEMMGTFGKIAKAYFKTCFMVPQAEMITPERIQAFLKIQHVLQQLLKRISKKQFKFSRVDKDTLFRSLYTEAQQKEILYSEREHSFFPYRKPSEGEKVTLGQGLQFKSNENVGSSTRVSFGKKTSTMIGYELYFYHPTLADLVMELDPDLVKREGLSQLEPWKQRARIYAGTGLPDWAKALRDAYLYYAHLLNEPVATPTSGAKAFSLNFKINDKEDKSEVIVGVDGVDGELLVENPKLKEIRKNKKLRFRGYHRWVKSPAVQAILDHKMVDSEKDLIASLEGIEGLNEDEVKELLHLRIESDLQAQEVLEYFTKHPEKLKDPDYQVLFNVLVFQRRVRGNDRKHFQTFIEKNMRRYGNEKEVQTCLFLLGLSRHLSSHFPDDYKDRMDHLRGWINNPHLTVKQRSLAYAEMVSNLVDEKTLNEGQVAELIKGVAFLHSQPVPEEWEDPLQNLAIKKTMIVHASSVKKVLEQGGVNQNLLNQLLRDCFNLPEQKWKKGNGVYHTEDGTCSFYPIEGRLTSPNTRMLLPTSIVEHPYFKLIFPTVVDGEYHEGGFYSFQSKDGKEIMVKMVDHKLVLEQKSCDGWYRLIPSNHFILLDDKKKVISALGSRYLTHHMIHWQSCQDPSKMIFVDPKDFKEKYTARIVDGNVVEVKESVSGYCLGASQSPLNCVEDRAYIHEWFEGKTAKKVELPRFGLTFVPDAKKKNCWMCEQFPGYVVKPQERIKGLGVYSHYLMIENQDGDKKVLLPSQDFFSTKGQKKNQETLEPLHFINAELALEHRGLQKYYAFDLKKDGTLSTLSRHANLFLAKVLTVVQEYERAVFYLKKYGDKLTNYTLEEKQLLQGISSAGLFTGDKDGNGIALRTYASYLRLRNTEKEEEVQKEDIENYLDYLAHYGNATALKLQSPEELFLLRTVLQKVKSPALISRLKQLDPVAASQMKFPAEDERRAKGPEEVSLHGVNFFSDSSSINQNQITRTKLSRGFRHHYKVALQGTDKEKALLRKCISFAKNKVSNQEKYALFLGCVLDHPTEFILGDYSKDWEERMVAKAEELLKKKAAEKVKEAKKAPEPIFTELPEPKKPSLPTASATAKLEATIKLSIPKTEMLATKAQKNNVFSTSTEKASEDFGDLKARFVQQAKDNSAPLVKKEYVRLQDDLEAHKKNLSSTIYDVDEAKLKKLLAAGKEEAAKTLKTMEKEILALANRPSDSGVKQVHHRLMGWAKLRKPITLQGLMINFGRRQLTLAMQQNPALTKEDIELLYKKVGSYLALATHEQQRKRAERTYAKLQTIQDSDDNAQLKRADLKQQLAVDLLSERHYDPEVRPAYLVFEYYADILMRQGQVEKMRTFFEQGDINPVVEMIMGSGKSKVLLPLLGMLRADGDALSMVIVPQALFESIASDTQNILKTTFGQDVRTLHFDRNTPFSIYLLEKKLNTLKNIREQRETLIVTSKTIHCLLLRAIEKFREFSLMGTTDHPPRELQLVLEIIALLKEKGYPIIDEADLILSMLRVVCFSDGEKRALKPTEVEIPMLIHEILYNDPSLKDFVRLKGRGNDKKPALIKALYDEKIKPRLIKAFIEKLSAVKEFPDGVKNFTKNLSKVDRTLLEQYLARDEKHITETNAFWKKQTEQVRDALALAAEEISSFLPHTLTRNCGEDYDVDWVKNGKLAIPHAGPFVPKRGSQFANPFITMNYTILTYLEKGCTVDQVKECLENFQKKALEQTEEGNKRTEETKAWAAFNRLRSGVDIPLFGYTENHLKALVTEINRTPKNTLGFVKEIILPHLQIQREKSDSRGHNLIALFGKVSGFTGTLWNGMSMPKKLTPMPEKGTDAKTLSLLWKNSRQAVSVIREGSSEAMLQQIEARGLSYSMIADAGAYFKDSTNRGIAELLQKMKKKPVVFYNKDGEQTVLEGNRKVPLHQSTLTEEERLTFLDQSHTTGADVKQGRLAVGIVTIGRNMLLRDLLQSVWRLRGLAKSQRVEFVLTEEVESILRQAIAKGAGPIEFGDILHFVIMNQSERQAKDNFMAFKAELASIPQMMLFDIILRKEIAMEKKLALFKTLGSTWIKVADKGPGELYGEVKPLRPSGDVIDDEVKQTLASIKALFATHPFLKEYGFSEEAICAKIKAIAEGIKGSLSAKLRGNVNEDDQTMENEEEKQAQEEIEVEEVTQEKGLRFGTIFSHYFKRVERIEEKDLKRGVVGKKIALELLLRQDEELAAYADLFDGIDISLDALCWKKQNPNPANIRLFGQHRVPFHFVQRSKRQGFVILSQKDADSRSMDCENLWLASPKKGEFGFENFIKVKFLNGESHYSKDELEFLEAWFTTKGKAEMKRLYEKKILRGISMRTQYQNSPLRELFREGA